MASINTHKKLDPEFKAKWIAALRSGEYKQGTVHLYNESNDSYCCLGVACFLHNGIRPKGSGFMPSGESGYTVLPAAINGGLTSNHAAYRLADMNDRGDSFNEIADWIEENL